MEEGDRVVSVARLAEREVEEAAAGAEAVAIGPEADALAGTTAADAGDHVAPDDPSADDPDAGEE